MAMERLSAPLLPNRLTPSSAGTLGLQGLFSRVATVARTYSWLSELFATGGFPMAQTTKADAAVGLNDGVISGDDGGRSDDDRAGGVAKHIVGHRSEHGPLEA